MNHYKALLTFIDELGNPLEIFVEFSMNNHSTTEQIEEMAISLGYKQLMNDGQNDTPDSQEYFYFHKIESLKLI